jgi:hypothetical protein
MASECGKPKKKVTEAREISNDPISVPEKKFDSIGNKVIPADEKQTAEDSGKGDQKTIPVPGKKKTGSGKDSIPVCVRKLIDAGNKNEPSTAPWQVDEYLYNGKKVFLFTAQCCDQFNTLYDISCNVICAPTGGFTGRGDGRCPDFGSTAKFVKLIWKDPR